MKRIRLELSERGYVNIFVTNQGPYSNDLKIEFVLDIMPIHSVINLKENEKKLV